MQGITDCACRDLSQQRSRTQPFRIELFRKGFKLRSCSEREESAGVTLIAGVRNKSIFPVRSVIKQEIKSQVREAVRCPRETAEAARQSPE